MSGTLSTSPNVNFYIAYNQVTITGNTDTNELVINMVAAQTAIPFIIKDSAATTVMSVATTGDIVGRDYTGRNLSASGTLSATGNLAINTNKFNVTASSGNTTVAGTLGVTGVLTATAGLVVPTAGSGITIKGGSNAKAGKATLVAGAVVVTTTAVTANSVIFLTTQPGTLTNTAHVYVSAIVNGTSFTITSASALDVSVIGWMIVEVN